MGIVPGSLAAAVVAAAIAAGTAALTIAAATADTAPRSVVTPATHRASPARLARPGIARLVRREEGPATDGLRVVADVPVGLSAGGRPIVATATGDPAARRHILVVGCIHGIECAGIPVTRQVLLAGPVPARADVWLVRNLDPDGLATGTRLNGHGVDLNRNFPAGWQPIGRPWDLQYSGPRAFSEPETRTARALIRWFRPTTTIWFHQQAEALVRAWGASVPAARRYARLAGLPFRRMRWLAGTAPHWQNTRFPGTAAFVVELPLGPLSRAAVRRHARAILDLSGVRR